MASIPIGRLTRGTIIDHGLQRAGNTKIKTLARVQLNRILEDLYLNWDWPFLYVQTSPTLTSTTFTLPSDFLQAADDDGLTITSVDSVINRHVVQEVERVKFDRTAVPSDAEASVPSIWTVDRTLGIARIWPRPTSSLAATLRYKQQPSDMATTDAAAYDADIPLFPWHNYLIQAIYQWALEYDKDERGDTEYTKLELSLEKIRAVAIPLRSQSPVVDLDPQVFTQPFRDFD